MASEEIGLNEALERDGVRVVETDLGEYILQLAGEHPAHIIAPRSRRRRSRSPPSSAQ
jgi:L-lactate dehydrogenase complex protein LldF